MSDYERRRPDERLHAIAGRWETSGQVIGEPTIPVVGTDIYEVLAGGYFVVHYVDVTVGKQPLRAIEIIGERDAVSGGYRARSFDSEGNAELMSLMIDEDGVFHFAGGDVAPIAQPTDESTARVRSTLTIADGRRSMTALWERSEDGITWHPWMDISFMRSD
jgi:hypothetical protein